MTDDRLMDKLDRIVALLEQIAEVNCEAIAENKSFMEEARSARRESEARARAIQAAQYTWALARQPQPKGPEQKGQ